MMVINAEEKGQYREVILGPQIGSFYLVKSGLLFGDMVAVEGYTRVEENMPMMIKAWNPNFEEKYRLNETMQAKLDEIMALIQAEIGG